MKEEKNTLIGSTGSFLASKSIQYLKKSWATSSLNLNQFTSDKLTENPTSVINNFLNSYMETKLKITFLFMFFILCTMLCLVYSFCTSFFI